MQTVEHKQRYHMMTGYVDFAEYYDYDHDISFDIPFYIDYAHQCQSPILELASGTGRLVISLAKAGFDVYGVDLSDNMLEVCRKAIHEQPFEQRVHLFTADMAHFDLARKDFHLAYIALRSFMHLLSMEEQLACVQRVYNHLQPQGQFIISVIAPDKEKLDRRPSNEFTVQREFDLPNGHHVQRKERLVQHDRANQVRHFEFKFEEFNSTGRLVRERVVPLKTRYIFRQELQIYLETAGFQIVNIYRDYNKTPYDGTGEIIAIARRP